MKYLSVFFLCFSTFSTFSTFINLDAKIPRVEKSKRIVERMPFVIFDDFGQNGFVPSGFMGDFESIRVNSMSIVSPKYGKKCISVEYSSQNQVEKWAGVYWQYPEGNWGSEGRRGKNLSKAKYFTFWARGETGKEYINEFGVGGLGSSLNKASIYAIKLTKEWKRYTIDLRKRADLKKRVVGGFFGLRTFWITLRVYIFT